MRKLINGYAILVVSSIFDCCYGYSQSYNQNRPSGSTRILLDQAPRRVGNDAPPLGRQIEEELKIQHEIQADHFQKQILAEGARSIRNRNLIQRLDPRFGGGFRTDLVDARTGMSADVAETREDVGEDALIEEDAFGPIGPGRRERLARIAGLTDEEARQIWPWKDPKPVRPSEILQAMKVLAAKYQGPIGQDDAAARLAPDQDPERRNRFRTAELSEAEASFAVYAALGFPFPIRVGKLLEPPPNGFVVFNPQLLSVDLLRERWTPRSIEYKWMNGSTVVYGSSADVTTYVILPRPTAPTTHLWLLSEAEDVMAYRLMGLNPPMNLEEVRETLFKHVTDVHSPMRVQVKLYGLRWSLMPGIDDITDNECTKAKLHSVMTDLGFLAAAKAQYLPSPAKALGPLLQ